MATVRAHSLPVLIAALCACVPAPLPPAGSYADVALVVADAGLVPGLRAGFDREEDFFVSSEPRFRVSVFAEDGFDRAGTFKSVVVCGVLDPGTAIGRRIAAIIGAEHESRVRGEHLRVIRREDHPVSGQLTLVVTAPTAEELRAFLAGRADEVAAIVEASARARLRANLLRDLREEAPGRRGRDFGFRLDVPALYEVFEGPDDAPGVEFRRDGPPRVLGVFWLPLSAAPSLEDTDALFAWRASYVARRYDGDRMDRARVRFDRSPLGALDPGARMAGYWYNDRQSTAGGYYETYFLRDEPAGRLWAIDLVVYAPGREKATLIRELRALAETFRTI